MKEELQKIVKICCDALKVDELQYYSESRKQEVVDCRHISKKLCSEVCKNTSEISRILDSDHATVIHSIKKYNELHETNGCFRKKAEKCRLAININKELSDPINPYNAFIMLIAMIDGNHSLADIKCNVQACKNSINYLTGSKIY
jgi:hypothetical protein